MEVKKKDEVKKALSPEETTVLGNIQSLITELVNMNTSGAAAAQPVAPPAPAAPAVPVAAKAEITTPSDGPTASDDEKKRIEDNIPEESQDKVKEVAKAAVLEMFGAMVKPAEPAVPVDPVLAAMKSLAESVKKIQENVNQNSQASMAIMDGMGVAKQMAVVKTAEAPKGGTPIVGEQDQMMKFASVLGNAINGVNKSEPKTEIAPIHTGGQITDQNSEIRKSLGDAKTLAALCIKGGASQLIQ